MFVVWVGAVLLTVSLPFAFSGFNLQIVLWLWLTLWFANFAEAIAEGRGRAEAAALQSTQSNLRARALKDDNEETTVDASTLKKGDRFVCEAGDTIPADGEIIEGIDSVNNDGPRGFTEILYEFSAAANNGSGYEGLGDDTVAWNLATGLIMLLGRFDELGSGVINIHKYLPAYSGGADPLFEDTREGFRLTLPLTLLTAKVPEASKTDPGAQSDSVTGQVGEQVKSRAQSGAQSRAQSGAQSDQILNLLKSEPLSADQLVQLLQLKGKTGAFKRSIKRLLEATLIERTIPEKPTSRLQKYRLTEKGKSLVNGGEP